MLTGLDRLTAQDFAPLRGQNIGVLVNQASVDARYRHALDLFLGAGLQIGALFGPQHGLWGHTQDNMVEWEGGTYRGIPLHSLYGEHREPTSAMICGLDRIVIDIFDVGSRYYTFIWSLALTMKACARHGIPVTILDRPNPINGVDTEGPLLEEGYESFVGRFAGLPIRHAKTAGEIARWLAEAHIRGVELEVVEVEGWDRNLYGDETDAPWAIPSPNMPTVETAVVYPGGCLLEATNLSEGRGTTRPFETFGAPFLDGWRMAEALSDLPGCVLRPLEFMPTFNKYRGQVCSGCFVHVTDRRAFRPVATYLRIIEEAIRQSGLHDASELPITETFVHEGAETRLPGFAWRQPPYEYEFNKMPFDILIGNGEMRGKLGL
ncbi:DUF1343 domain-containing protein [bacterium]|nr:MAG: DUF1343 domain-containing protein [bacterium]